MIGIGEWRLQVSKQIGATDKWFLLPSLYLRRSKLGSLKRVEIGFVFCNSGAWVALMLGKPRQAE
jgi:hypothetical protein